jgi:hypothetical protein
MEGGVRAADAVIVAKLLAPRSTRRESIRGPQRKQVEALLAGTQEFYHTSGELTGYMICIFSWPLLRTIPEAIQRTWLMHSPPIRTFQISTIIIYCQVLRPLCAHFTKILGAFLSGIRNTFPTLHNIRGFTILTTAGDLYKSTSFSLRNVLNLSPTSVL